MFNTLVIETTTFITLKHNHHSDNIIIFEILNEKIRKLGNKMDNRKDWLGTYFKKRQ